MKYVALGLIALAVVIPTANYVTSVIVDAVLLSAAGWIVIKKLKSE